MSISLVYKRERLYKEEKEENFTPLHQLIKHFSNARWESPQDIQALSPPLTLADPSANKLLTVFPRDERNKTHSDTAFIHIFSAPCS